MLASCKKACELSLVIRKIMFWFNIIVITILWINRNTWLKISQNSVLHIFTTLVFVTKSSKLMFIMCSKSLIFPLCMVFPIFLLFVFIVPNFLTLLFTLLASIKTDITVLIVSNLLLLMCPLLIWFLLFPYFQS